MPLIKSGEAYNKYALSGDRFGNFSFDLAQLAVSRNIARGLHLDDMVGVEYITTGSNSHIFGATWNNQAVVIKVRNVFFSKIKQSD